ncbi:hypothetical protein EUX98_g5122 [Antrodiella citrinella]|uniref:Mid2 domain-containing protein n=1 Tax=Antrodiella citrinella TaxID=2447956 RepID=A0A4S4MSB7_9APHY|nr:hypothetical protein EUX98_g5122 [Antrodiella citrinella]
MKKKLWLFIAQTIPVWLLLRLGYVQANPTGITVYYAETPTTAPQPTQPSLGDPHGRRALYEIFDTLNYGGPTPNGGQDGHRAEATHGRDANELVSSQRAHFTQDGLLGHLANPGSTTTGSTTSPHSQSTTTTQGKYSVIGTLPPIPSPTAGNTIMTSWASTPTYTLPTSTPISDAASKKDQAIKQWKIIGVAVIAFSTVSAILLLAVFFDQWWRFVKDVIGKGRGRKLGKDKEELVPDWEKASWEVRFGDDRHRYPSFTSFPSSETGMKNKTTSTTTNEGGWTRPQHNRSPLRDGADDTNTDASASQEMDISAMSPHQVPVHPIPHYNVFSPPPDTPLPKPSAAPSSIPSSPRLQSLNTGATLARSKSQRSQLDPFQDPPRSPRTRSISMRSIGGESVYGGIA